MRSGPQKALQRCREDNATSPESISSSKLFKLCAGTGFEEPGRYLQPEVPKWALLDPVNEWLGRATT